MSMRIAAAAILLVLTGTARAAENLYTPTSGPACPDANQKEQFNV